MKGARLVAIVAVFLAGTFWATFAVGQEQTAAPVQPKAKMSCEDRFKSLDTNHDGVVTLEEFMANRRPGSRAEETFKRKDVKGDGKLTLEEFCARPPKRTCQERFQMLDTNKDGVISFEEFMANPHRPRNAEAVFKKKDVNGDGNLTMEEFCSGRAKAFPREE